jgi:hypothetical protein
MVWYGTNNVELLASLWALVKDGMDHVCTCTHIGFFFSPFFSFIRPSAFEILIRRQWGWIGKLLDIPRLEFMGIWDWDLGKIGRLGFWIMDFGLWTLDYGLWIMDFGLWTLDYGLWNFRDLEGVIGKFWVWLGWTGRGWA